MGRKFEVRKQAMMKTGLQKSKLYSRYGKEIYICAKQGGTNIDANFALKHLIERARKEDVPNDVIERNIEKAAGGSGEDFTAIRYEGFGPEGCNYIVDTLTDNVNRTVSEVRACFTKIDSKLGVNGSVEHSYRHQSIVHITGVSADLALEALLDAEIDVEDIDEEDDGVIITGEGYDLDKIEAVFRAMNNVSIIDSERGWYPLETIRLNEEAKSLHETFLTCINALDDVQNVYHNVEDE